MSIVIPNGGVRRMLDAATGKIAATPWTLRLFTSVEPTLDNKTLVAHFTEAEGHAVPLDAALWATDPGKRAETSYPLLTFVFDGPGPSIPGFYVTDATGTLIFAEYLSGPFTPVNKGDMLAIALKVTLGSIGG